MIFHFPLSLATHYICHLQHKPTNNNQNSPYAFTSLLLFTTIKREALNGRHRKLNVETPSHSARLTCFWLLWQPHSLTLHATCRQYSCQSNWKNVRNFVWFIHATHWHSKCRNFNLIALVAEGWGAIFINTKNKYNKAKRIEKNL